MIKNKLSIMMGVRKMNMAELARLAGLSHVAVFRIYHNKTKTIELETSPFQSYRKYSLKSNCSAHTNHLP